MSDKPTFDGWQLPSFSTKSLDVYALKIEGSKQTNAGHTSFLAMLKSYETGPMTIKQPAAMLVGFIYQTSPGGHHLRWVTDVWVNPSLRRRGIGMELLSGVHSWWCPDVGPIFIQGVTVSGKALAKAWKRRSRDE